MSNNGNEKTLTEKQARAQVQTMFAGLVAETLIGRKPVAAIRQAAATTRKHAESFGAWTQDRILQAQLVSQVGALVAKYGLDELKELLNLVERMRISILPEGVERYAPSDLTFGIKMGEHRDGSAITFPSAVSQRTGEPQVTLVLKESRNLLPLLFGSKSQAAQTNKANILIRALPVRAKGFEETVRRLKWQVPSCCRKEFSQAFLNPLSDAILPPEGREIVGRQAVLWLPLWTVLRNYQKELLTLLGLKTLEPGELAALIDSLWKGEPTPKKFEGRVKSLLWRATPYNAMPKKDVFVGGEEAFFFFHIQPKINGEAIERLRKLDLDLLLTLEVLRDGRLIAQVTARGRKGKRPGRASFFKEQLLDCCEGVWRITGEPNIVEAIWSFQPGSPPARMVRPFTVTDPDLLINGLTRGLSPLMQKGKEIFFGFETDSGVPHMLPYAHRVRGGNFHCLFLGLGTYGKTAWELCLALQEAGPWIFSASWTSASDEAFPSISWAFGQNQEKVELTHDKQGINFVCLPAENGSRPRREWIFDFKTSGGRNLEKTFREIVIPSIRNWVEAIQLPDDFPISVRPSPGCNMRLFSGAIALAWTGVDPWGQNQFSGLRTKVIEMLEKAGENPRMIVRLDDLAKVPPSSVYGEAVARMISDTTAEDQKYGIALHCMFHEEKEVKILLKKSPGKFHLVVRVERVEDENGYPVRLYKLYKRLEDAEPIVVTTFDLKDHPNTLFKLLAREKEGA